jgi:hypothetical protein
MNDDEQKTEQTAVNVGKKIASTELSIPLNIPLKGQQPAPVDQASAQEQTPEASDPSEESHEPTNNLQPSNPHEETEPQPKSEGESAQQQEGGEEPSQQPTSNPEKTSGANGTAPPPDQQPEQQSAPNDQDQEQSSDAPTPPPMPPDQTGKMPEQTTAAEQLSEAIQNVSPIKVEATASEAKAATNPIVKLLVAIGAGVSLIGLICLFVFGVIVGASILLFGVLVVVGGVLSPKPKG